MKKKFLLWLDTIPHKPKWLKKKIEMAYWSDLLDLQKQKEKKKSELDKKLLDIEEKISQYVNGLRKSLLATDNDGGLKMCQLSSEEATKKMIKMMKQGKGKYSDKEIYRRLADLGLKPKGLVLNEKENLTWQDMGTGKLYKVDEPTPKQAPVSKETAMILKEVSRTVEQKPKRRTSNGKRKTTAKAHA